jgi:hypothetical protein
MRLEALCTNLLKFDRAGPTVRQGDADPTIVANMLEHRAKRFEQYEARVSELEDDCAALLRAPYDGVVIAIGGFCTRLLFRAHCGAIFD